jgi:predicted GNAT family acetyltransferase
MHPLDNVIWQALTTRQSQFAEGSANARRFVREVSPLSGFEEPSEANYAALAALVGDGATMAVFLDQPFTQRPGWEFVVGAPLVQMVCHKRAPFAASNGHAILELGSSESPEMLELTALTKPGPFGTRTHELGGYLGIRDHGRLVAMAGERLKVPGFTEISAVCTHPEHTGKRYARLLMSEIIDRIRARGETPFLHVRQDNARAIAVYELLGCRTRRLLHFAVLRRVR